MNADEWKEVLPWYPFSLCSLLPDGRWFEQAGYKMRDDAYQSMRALAARKPRDYFLIVQCTLAGKGGREKAGVYCPGSQSGLLRERQECIKLGWKAEERK